MSIASPQSGRFPSSPDPLPFYRRPLLWVGLLAVLLGGVIAYRVIGFAPATRVELPVLSAVPDFTFVDQSGAPLSAHSLTGELWVANFIFTRCPNVCPKFTAKMATLQERSARELPSLRLVSFTVDPENDTPDVLLAYGQKYQADFTRWRFAQGPRSELERVIRDGMLQPMERGDGVDLNSVVHGSYFALIDAQLRVRGVYRFTDADSLDLLLRDAKILADMR